MKPKPAEILRADVRGLLSTYGVRSVLAELSGQLFERHVDAVHDNPEKWLYRKWSQRLEDMAEEIAKEV